MAHFEGALAFCSQAGYRPELAWTCFDYAGLLLSQGEHQKAQTLLDEAKSISFDLGMRPLYQKALALMNSSPPQQLPASKYPSSLTEREVEVLRLVARGATNSEIAGDLVLSQRTVQRHISNIYAKIAARNRADATTFFLTHLDPSS
jgi:DNA-binding NarL/FixJ family response regulator